MSVPGTVFRNVSVFDSTAFPCPGMFPYLAALFVFRNVSVFDSTAISVFKKGSVPGSVFRNVPVPDSHGLCPGTYPCLALLVCVQERTRA